ncbi:MAG: type III secretion system export apparatus subunit SctT [Pseudomonadota bacterium]
MIDQLAVIEPYITAFFLSLPRLIALFALIPFLGRTSLPGIVQTGVVMSFALVIQPSVLGALPSESLSAYSLIAIVLKEIFIGLMMGFAFVMLFHAIQAAGFFIDNQRGSTMASSIDPMLGGQTSTTGLLLLQAFLAYFFATGGFLAMLGVVYGSYEVMPVLSFVPQMPISGAIFALEQLDRMVYLTFVLAAPVVAAMLLAEVAVAFVSRFAPQLNVFFIAMPIKCGVAFLVLILYVGTLVRHVDVASTPFATLFEQIEGLM